MCKLCGLGFVGHGLGWMAVSYAELVLLVHDAVSRAEPSILAGAVATCATRAWIDRSAELEADRLERRGAPLAPRVERLPAGQELWLGSTTADGGSSRPVASYALPSPPAAQTRPRELPRSRAPPDYWRW